MQTKTYLTLYLPLVVILALGADRAALATDAAALLQQYHVLVATVKDNPFKAPIAVHSKDDGEVATAEVYGVLDKPFADIAAILGDLASWCQFMPLSLNIKACTWSKFLATVTLYIGPKEYHAPTDFSVSKVAFTYKVSQLPQQINIELTTASGATGTERNTIVVEAMAATPAQTVVHFVSTTEFTYAGRLAMDTYLATMGSSRIGFSMVTNDEGQLPAPIKGIKGVVERNAMRYYLALQAYSEQRGTPGTDLFYRCAGDWFDLTEHYPKQLHELDKQTYLDSKRHEHMNQQELEAKITNEE